MNSIQYHVLAPNGAHQSLWQPYYTPPKTAPHVLAVWQGLIARAQHDWQTFDSQDDFLLTSWLMDIFNALFCHRNTVLVRGGDEPEYLAATHTTPAQIIFAHGYFASALHEIAHWCLAGQARRQLNDFGYWYCPDGRDAQTQARFEKVEIRPQAIECLLTLATGRYFYVSQDNLNADFDTSNSTFARDVYEQALCYLRQEQPLSTDARLLLSLLLNVCQTRSN